MLYCIPSESPCRVFNRAYILLLFLLIYFSKILHFCVYSRIYCILSQESMKIKIHFTKCVSLIWYRNQLHFFCRNIQAFKRKNKLPTWIIKVHTQTKHCGIFDISKKSVLYLLWFRSSVVQCGLFGEGQLDLQIVTAVPATHEQLLFLRG